jgi:hypothetical protein
MNFSPSIYYRKYSPLSTYPLLQADGAAMPARSIISTFSYSTGMSV